MVSSVASMLAMACVWQNYTLNNAVPSNAVLAGLNIYEGSSGKTQRGIDFAYVARTREGPSETGLLRVYQKRKTSIGIVWDSPLTSLQYKRYDGPNTNKRAEILTCDDRLSNEIRWMTFDEAKLDVSRCVEVGRSASSDEPVLLARVDVDCLDCKDKGRVPAIYMPDLGFAVTHFSDFQVFLRFELLCVAEDE